MAHRLGLLGASHETRLRATIILILCTTCGWQTTACLGEELDGLAICVLRCHWFDCVTLHSCAEVEASSSLCKLVGHRVGVDTGKHVRGCCLSGASSVPHG